MSAMARRFAGRWQISMSFIIWQRALAWVRSMYEISEYTSVNNVGTAVLLETDRSHALRSAIQACRKGGTVSIPGVYGGLLDLFPLGAAFAKGLTLKMGQTNVHRYLPRLLKLIEDGKIDPTFLITHRVALDQGPEAYKTLRDKKDRCIKVVMKP